MPVFRQEGASIAALDRNDKVLAVAEMLGKAGITAKPAVADIARCQKPWPPPSTRFGEVHVLINNAGILRHPTFANTDPAGLADDITATPAAPMPVPMRCCRG